MTFFDRLHQYLPLGYLYLVILGIFRETIAFYQLGINYMTYASLMDILLSPISAMTDHPLVFGVVTAYLLFFFLYPWLVMKKAGNKMRGKLLGDKKLNRDMTDDEKKNTVLIHFVRGSALGLLAFFLGFGWSLGQQTKKRLHNNTLKYKYSLNFVNGDKKSVHLIESNSMYYFYVVKGAKNISISPISSINTIELIDNKMLEKK